MPSELIVIVFMVLDPVTVIGVVELGMPVWWAKVMLKGSGVIVILPFTVKVSSKAGLPFRNKVIWFVGVVM